MGKLSTTGMLNNALSGTGTAHKNHFRDGCRAARTDCLAHQDLMQIFLLHALGPEIYEHGIKGIYP